MSSRTWILALVLCAPLYGSQAPGEGARSRVNTILRDAQEGTIERTCSRLIALGDGDVPAMFEIYASNMGSGAELPQARSATALDELQQRAILCALQGMPAAWRRLFNELAHAPSTAPQREIAARAALRVIAEIGEAQDTHMLLDLARCLPQEPAAVQPADAGAVDGPADIDEQAAGEFEQGVVRWLARDPQSLAQLEALFFAADVSVQPLLVHAITKTGSLPGVGTLSRLLGRNEALDLSLVTGITRCVSNLAPPFDERIGEAVRACLSTGNENLLREAALAVGKLEDGDSVHSLVTLLSHAHRGVRENAHWSLQRITSLRIAADPNAWSAWLKSEATWWGENAPAMFTELENAPRARGRVIVQEVARRRFPRDGVVHELSNALSHEDAQIRALICTALGQLRSRRALPALLLALDDVDAEVRTEAGKALCAVTGLELPASRVAWAQAGF